MYYEDTGEGTAVLFIHGGFGGVESTLFPQPSVFNGVLPLETFRTITYDRRNSGRSGYATKPFAIEDLAGDAAALLDHLGIDRAIVVGDSMGGMVAMKFALRWPERTTGLMLAETAPRIIKGRPLIKATLAVSRVLPPRLVYTLFKRRVTTPPRYAPVGPEARESQASRDERWASYLKQLREMPGDDLYRYSVGLLRTYVAYFGRDISGDVERLSTVPTHILHGTSDTVVSIRGAEKLHYLIRASQMHRLEGLTHGLFYYDEARELARSVIEQMAAAAAPRKHGWAGRPI
jgi:pimeloyl-ACP methyl ester carboxylesterase